MMQQHLIQHRRKVASVDVWRTLRYLALAAFLLVGLPELSTLAEVGGGAVPVDDCGNPLIPWVKHLGRAGTGLGITVRSPLSDPLPDGVWVLQRDAIGELVGEAWVQPSGGEVEASAIIDGGLRAALDRGPAFTLDLLDENRQPIAEGIPLIIQLDCQDAMTCRLEPVLGISAKGAIHVSPDLFSVMKSRIESGQPISIEDFSTQHPNLVGPLLNLLWQSSFQAPTPETCRCHWISASDKTYMTGGAHLVWTNGIAPEPPDERYPGSTELYTWLMCTMPPPPLPPYDFVVDAGDEVEVEVASHLGTACDAPCEPRIVQDLFYPSRALVQGSPLGAIPDHHTIVDNEVLWWTGSESGDASLVAVASTEASLSAPRVTQRLQTSTKHRGLSSYARFEGSTRIDLQLDWVLRGLFASLLEMKVGTEACQGVPAFETGLVIQPNFNDGEVITGPRPCGQEHHTSLVIETGGE